MVKIGEKRKAEESKEPGGPAPRIQLATLAKRRDPVELKIKKKRICDQEKIYTETVTKRTIQEGFEHKFIKNVHIKETLYKEEELEDTTRATCCLAVKKNANEVTFEHIITFHVKKTTTSHKMPWKSIDLHASIAGKDHLGEIKDTQSSESGITEKYEHVSKITSIDESKKYQPNPFSSDESD